MPRRPPPAVLCATLGALALCACTRQANDRLALGEDIVPAAFAHEAQRTPTDARVLGLDRSNWEPMVYEIPVNGVAHQPIYAPTTFGLETLPRQRGEYPTSLSSLDLGEPSPASDLGQMFRSHGQAVLDAALLLPRLVLRPPTATDWSPRVSYDRASASVISAPWCGACDGPCRGAECAEAGEGQEPALLTETGEGAGTAQE
ncbi:MAG TPA: hypothetical protein VFF69_03890 [Phycisphaerales bacterium]|nr:hypothetical protein [Phycisphaerales bacterium]